MASFALEWVLLILILIIIVVKFMESKKQRSGLDSNIPGPTALPIVGSLFKLGKKPHLNFMELSKTYGDIYRISLGCREFVVLNSHDTITEAYFNKSIEFAGRPDLSLSTVLSDSGGFAFMDYTSKWKVYRKLIVRGINHIVSPHSYTENFSASLHKVSKHFVNTMLENKDKPYDPVEDIRNTMFLFISSFTFGQKFTKLDKTVLNFFSKEVENGKLIARLSIGDFFPFLKPFLGSINTLKRMIEEQLECINGMFIDRLTMDREPGNVQCIFDAFLSYSDRNDIRKETEEKISHQEILHLLFAIYGAGIDTTKSYIQYCILYLVAFPEHQRNIQHEIDEIIPGNESPSIENVEKLNNLKAFMFEVERFASFFPFGLMRKVTRDTTIRSFFLPKNTDIIPNIYSAHFDSSAWKNPEKFEPSRFFCDEGSGIDPNTVNKLLLFGGGRRRCPGQYMARKNVAVIMASLLQLCNIEAAPGEKLDLNDVTFALSLQPQRIKIIVSSRN